jgi:hypothetical protein
MKIDTIKIEQRIYSNICENFANWCEMQLKQYDSLLKYFATITIEEMENEHTKVFYENYEKFCIENGLNVLPQKALATIMTSIGFPAQCKTINKKKVYCYMRGSGKVK